MLKEKSKNLLIIVDDILPQNLSSFRNVEMIEYINTFDNLLFINISAAKLDNAKILKEISEKKIKYFQTNFDDENLNKIEEYINQFDKKVSIVTFLNNILGYEGKVLSFFEKNNIKFSFTLYPGGGLFINNETTEKLKRVFNSPSFYKVIVTQIQCYNFLVDNELCDINNICFIYGLPTSSKMLKVNIKKKKCFFTSKNPILNICFVAYKYSSKGKDKGYDTFIDVAKKLSCIYDNVYFHVVGNFTEEDIDLGEIRIKVKFYGVLNNSDFIEFYKDKDILLSPTRANILYEGAFDGFPTGASSDAMLNGLLLLTTDPLCNNFAFNNYKDLIIVDNRVDGIVDVIVSLVDNKRQMKKIAYKGYKKANRIYNRRKQIIPRIKLIKEMEVLDE